MRCTFFLSADNGNDMLDRSAIPELPDFDWQNVHAEKVQNLTLYADYLNYYGIHFSESLKKYSVNHHLGLQQLAGFDIAVHYYRQPKAKGVVLVTHGYMDHVGLYAHLLKSLLENGFNVLAYDLPGHGLSSGEQAGIADFSCYQKVMIALMKKADGNFSGPHYAVAQSTGCSITMDYLLHNKKHRFQKAVLLAPLVIPRRWRGIKVLLMCSRYFLTQVKRGFRYNSADAEFRDFLQYKDPLQTRFIKASWLNALVKWQAHFASSGVCDIPVLVIQGKQDGTVQWEYNLPAIQQHFCNYKEVLLAQANHQLVNEAQAVRKEVLTAVSDYLT